MIKKNSVFIVLLVMSLVLYSAILVKLDQVQQEKIFKLQLEDSTTKNSSTVVNQQSLNTEHKFSGKTVHENNHSYVLLTWTYDTSKITKAELYVNGKKHSDIKKNQTKEKVDIIKNGLIPDGNIFELKLYSGETSSSTKINVSTGYIYDMQYTLISLNDKLLLQYSYLTHKLSPVSTPVVKSSRNLIVTQYQNSMSEEMNQHIRHTHYYEIDTSKYGVGNYNELLIWFVESINYEFSQDIQFVK